MVNGWLKDHDPGRVGNPLAAFPGFHPNAPHLGLDFAVAVGWEEATEPAEPKAPVETVDVTISESNDDVPEPVVVGPALRSTDAVTVADAGGSVAPLPSVVEPEYDDVAIDQSIPAAIAELIPETIAQPIPIEAISAAAELNWEAAEASDAIDEVASAEPEPEDVLDAPPGMGAVGWSTTALLRLGLPGPVISAVTGLDERDDLGWIETIAATVAPHCGPLPTGDVIVVGPHAERLAEPLGLPLVRAGDMAPYDGSFCAMVEDSAEDRKWLEFVRGGRGIHLVVGDDPWQDLLIDEPVAVSWVGENAVASALYLAFTLGATLGFGTVDGFVSTMVRAQSTDIALAIRRIVGRQ